MKNLLDQVNIVFRIGLSDGSEVVEDFLDVVLVIER